MPETCVHGRDLRTLRDDCPPCVVLQDGPGGRIIAPPAVRYEMAHPIPTGEGIEEREEGRPQLLRAILWTVVIIAGFYVGARFVVALLGPALGA